MVPTKFQFIWLRGFRGIFICKILPGVSFVFSNTCQMLEVVGFVDIDGIFTKERYCFRII